MRRLTIFISVLFFSVTLAVAGVAEQSDWSGSDGVAGPVFDWANNYSTADHINNRSVPGALELSIPYGEHLISDEVTTPSAIIFDNFTGDTTDDCVVFTCEGLFLFENLNGDGTEWAKHTIYSDSQAAPMGWLSSSDYDNDGDLDISLSESGLNLSWFENTGNGLTWTLHTIVDADVRESRAADFNGDGYDDIAVLINNTADIVWYENRLAAGLSWVPHYIDGGYIGGYSCDPGDFDGNGTIDIVVASYQTGNISYYLSFPNTDNIWEKHVVTDCFEHPYCVRAAYIDSDDLIDFTAVCYTNNYLSWWRNDNWTTWELKTVSSEPDCPTKVLPTDMNNDGDIDLLTTSYGSNLISWFDNTDGTGDTWELIEEFSCSQPYDLSLCDINGDGINEFAAPSFCQNKVYYWYLYGFDQSGELTSSIFDTGEDEIFWEYIHWDAYLLPYTYAVIYVRGSDNPDNMGTWSIPLTSSQTLDDLLETTDRYVQYKIELSTENTRYTPVFNDISLIWGIYGLESTEQDDRFLYLNTANPVPSSFTVSFRLTETGTANLAIYDVTGRQIRTLANTTLEEGTYSATVNSLPSGRYVCIYTAPGISESLNFTVIR